MKKRDNTMIEKRMFERLCLLNPLNFNITNYNRMPLAAYNPAIIIRENNLYLFPRLVFDYCYWTSSIGMCKPIPLPRISENLENWDLDTKIIQYPQTKLNLRGCEDPRGWNNRLEWVDLESLGTAKNSKVRTHHSIGTIDFERRELIDKKTFEFVKEWSTKIESGRDFAILNDKIMLCRPQCKSLDCYSTTWHEDNEGAYLNYHDLKIIIKTDSDELKTGWSTNVVKVAKHRYIVGWHAVRKDDMIYYNGLAILNEEGELQGLTEGILYAEGIDEIYGDRPNVIFGDGLFIYNKFLYWVGGCSDYCIGFFRCPLDKIMNEINYIKK